MIKQQQNKRLTVPISKAINTYKAETKERNTYKNCFYFVGLLLCYHANNLYGIQSLKNLQPTCKGNSPRFISFVLSRLNERLLKLSPSCTRRSIITSCSSYPLRAEDMEICLNHSRSDLEWTTGRYT